MPTDVSNAKEVGKNGRRSSTQVLSSSTFEHVSNRTRTLTIRRTRHLVTIACLVLLTHEKRNTAAATSYLHALRPTLWQLRGGAIHPSSSMARTSKRFTVNSKALTSPIRKVTGAIRGGKKDPAKGHEDPRITFLIQLLFLTYYGSLGSLLPYLPVYYHSLGHGGEESCWFARSNHLK